MNTINHEASDFIFWHPILKIKIEHRQRLFMARLSKANSMNNYTEVGENVNFSVLMILKYTRKILIMLIFLICLSLYEQYDKS